MGGRGQGRNERNFSVILRWKRTVLVYVCKYILYGPSPGAAEPRPAENSITYARPAALTLATGSLKTWVGALYRALVRVALTRFDPNLATSARPQNLAAPTSPFPITVGHKSAGDPLHHIAVYTLVASASMAEWGCSGLHSAADASCT